MKKSSVLVVLLGFLLTMTAAMPLSANANRAVAGKVTRRGEPVVGVGVLLLDTSAGVIRMACTDEEGKYRFPKAVVANHHLFVVGPFNEILGDRVGDAPCTNLAFESPGRPAWLNYRHPGLHGEFGLRSGFDLPSGQGAYKIQVRLRVAKHTCKGYKANIAGTAGPDELTGTPQTDVMTGKGGNDTITGGGEGDLICGDGGRDNINGQGGRDLIYGGVGNDILRGNAGGDVVDGEEGNDRVFGNGGPDNLHGGPGNLDRLIGGPGNDYCTDDVAKVIDCENVGS